MLGKVSSFAGSQRLAVLSALPLIKPQKAIVHRNPVALPRAQRLNVLCQSQRGNIVSGAAASETPSLQRLHRSEKSGAYSPSEQVMKTWQTADAVCFDVDCTLTLSDTLDLLAEFKGVKEQDEEISKQAEDGAMNMREALGQRLALLNLTPDDVEEFQKQYPTEKRLAPGAEVLVTALKARGVNVFLVSGAFRELILPVAQHLGIAEKNVFCNSMEWELDRNGNPRRLRGFDLTSPTAYRQGKPQAMARIRQQYPYNNVVMIGDGITDLSAGKVPNGADAFIGFGGVVERSAVAEQCDWYVRSFDELLSTLKKYKVAMVGSGAWACSALRMVAQSTREAAESPASVFVPEVSMWVYGDDFQGQSLTQIINTKHENPKYLPGIDLGWNVHATNSLEETVDGAELIIFCAPHQFIHGICKRLAAANVVSKGAKAISLTKGMRVRSGGPQLISEMVVRTLGIDCSVLMGANIAGDIAREELSEAVIAYTNREAAELWRQLFQRPYFSISLLPDVAGAEMCGTLKNIVALGAGMVDGLGVGPNSKASILRQGLNEMRWFCKALYSGVREDTFFESCGMADLVASSYGGRNRKVAEAWTKLRLAGTMEVTFEELERDMLSGQKLQGVMTSDEVQEILRARGWELDFPLFTTINRIIHGEVHPSMIQRYKEGASMPSESFPDGVATRSVH